MFATVATNSALNPSLATIRVFEGATTAYPPIKIPIEPKPAKPHNATVIIALVDCDNVVNAGSEKATASFVINLVANMELTAAASFDGTPINKDIG